MDLEDLNRRIAGPDAAACQRAHDRWARCAHPLGSLGLLEEAIETIAALTGDEEVRLSPRTLVVFCADNGVVAQGVAQSTAEVTRVVARGLAAGRSSACAMARVARCAVLPVDLGIQDMTPVAGLLDRRLGNGTGDISQGPAASRQTMLDAIAIGMDLVRQLRDEGCRLVALGEMGIGNTTTTAALTCALLGLDPESVTGRGAGLNDVGLARKRAVVRQALQVNAPDPTDVVDCLAKVGGFDLAALAGACLGGALSRVPILLDGVITLAAALCAVRIAPACRCALIATHASAEPAAQALLAALGLHPFIYGGLRLGEGTGALAAMPLLDMALALYDDGATFDAYGIDAYEPWQREP